MLGGHWSVLANSDHIPGAREGRWANLAARIIILHEVFDRNLSCVPLKGKSFVPAAILEARIDPRNMCCNTGVRRSTSLVAFLPSLELPCFTDRKSDSNKSRSPKDPRPCRPTQVLSSTFYNSMWTSDSRLSVVSRSSSALCLDTVEVSCSQCQGTGS
jgi:hypothetical protein